MDYRGIFGYGRGSMLNRLKILGAMGSIFGSMFGMGMGASTPKRGNHPPRALTAKEYARRKTRQKMARMSRRRNRKVA